MVSWSDSCLSSIFRVKHTDTYLDRQILRPMTLTYTVHMSIFNTCKVFPRDWARLSNLEFDEIIMDNRFRETELDWSISSLMKSPTSTCASLLMGTSSNTERMTLLNHKINLEKIGTSVLSQELKSRWIILPQEI